MKKQRWMMLTYLLVGMLLLTGCNSGTPAETDTAGETVVATEGETKAPPETETDTVAETKPADKMTIGGVGISEFTVVHAPDLPEGQRDAVNDLIQYVAEATGVTLPVITSEQTAEHEIVIGNGLRENAKVTEAVGEIKDDGYAIVEDAGHLYISASTGRGVAYGVYDFLEKYVGVRFYPVQYAVVKAPETIEIPADTRIVFSPAFPGRNRGIWTGEFSQADRDRAKNNNGDLSRFGDNIITITQSAHNIDQLVGISSECLPCMTDETIYQTVLKNLRDKLAASPNVTGVAVGQPDGYAQSYCHCDNCEALNQAEGTVMGSLLPFVNRLAEEIADEYPGVDIFLYAYMYSVEPPKTIRAADNIVISLCTIDCCVNHPFNDPNCEANVNFARQLREWSEICDKIAIRDYSQSFICDHTVGNIVYNWWDNIQLYRENGVIAISPELHNEGEFFALRHYLWTKLMWDPDLTKEEYLALIDQFFDDYYGAAGPLIRSYFERTTEAALSPQYWQEDRGGRVYMNDGHWDIWTDRDIYYKAYNEDGTKNITFTLEMKALWDEAFEADLSEVERLHLEKSYVHFLKYYRDYYPFASRKDHKVVDDQYKQLCEKFNLRP